MITSLAPATQRSNCVQYDQLFVLHFSSPFCSHPLQSLSLLIILSRLTQSSLTLSNRLCPSLARYHSASVFIYFFHCVCERAESLFPDGVLV